MRRQTCTAMPHDTRGLVPARRFSPAQASTRLFLIGAESRLDAPVILHGHAVQRMRAMVLFSGNPLPGGSRPAVFGPLPVLSPERMNEFQEGHGPLRHIIGEILRDRNGGLYEMSGNTVRAIGQICAGPDGRLLDLGGCEGETRDGSPAATDLPHPAEAPPPTIAPPGSPGAPHWKMPSAPLDPQSSPKPPPADLVRVLLREPGLWQVVRFGELRDMLAPQLSHPERLQDSHQLACHLQVYEAVRSQPWSTFVRAACGVSADPRSLRPWNMEAAARFGLRLAPPGRPSAPAGVDSRPKNGMVSPFERFYRLKPFMDPTAVEPVASLREPPPLSVSQSEPVPRHTIPERFLSPWEFKISREEALYDMGVSRERSLARRLWNRLARRGGPTKGDLRKWQALLRGRKMEEQLWAVPPPSGGLTHPAVREWTQQMLSAGGYEASRMMEEWEIYWRRKGVR